MLRFQSLRPDLPGAAQNNKTQNVITQRQNNAVVPNFVHFFSKCLFVILFPFDTLLCVHEIEFKFE